MIAQRSTLYDLHDMSASFSCFTSNTLVHKFKVPRECVYRGRCVQALGESVTARLLTSVIDESES